MSDATIKELEQLQNEKRKMLMEHETLKLKQREEAFAKELREWKAQLKPRKQKIEEVLYQELGKGRYIQFPPVMTKLESRSMSLESSSSSSPATTPINEMTNIRWGHTRSWSTGVHVSSHKSRLLTSSPNLQSHDSLV
ncbi:hypothetical protein RI129_001533 [Pyrocoelia pectoralis]|uniref:Uncharacterized protein n=1 Tax=Pyrocoelia pectoralis TaxID=417401 RepID=A0AAN7VVS0_9COLE